ncbi:MAG: tetratricopeptide repeat protein [Pseudomonadota bacterium]
MSDPNASQKKEVIDAVELSPIQSSSRSSSQHFANNSSSRWLWVSLSILLVLAVMVIFLLPKAVQEDISDSNQSKESLLETDIVEEVDQVPEQISTETEESSTAEIISLREQEQTKVQVEELIASLIKLEKNLESHAVKKWAAEEFMQAQEQGRIGDEFFRRRDYAGAIEPFENAIAQFQALEQLIQPTLERALERGEQALIQGDEVTATQQFELAKSIENNNVRAINGLQRASTIKELFAILRRASSFESHGQLQQAKTTYQEAVTLDPLSNEAKSSLARVESKLNDQAFEQIIATAYRALQNSQYSDARAAFNSANTLKPNSNEPTIGLNKVAEAIRQEKISNLLFEANHFAELQQWQQSAESYEKVLELNSNNQAAQQGLQVSLAKAKSLADLKIALASADQLYKDDVLEQAEDLLLRIEDLESPGSVIQQQFEKLRQLVHVASTPVAVTLESDSNTQVTVFKVARLGTFDRHQLQLRPGPYTIVGTRNGYRDVRISIQVSPENQDSIISVRCEEAI